MRFGLAPLCDREGASANGAGSLHRPFLRGLGARMLRIVTLVCGVLGAVSLSQFPEFSQQYLQRLAGAVDELTGVVADFDSSAQGVGLTREDALAALNDGAFQQARQADMRATIARSERLSADLASLRDAPVWARALQPHRFMDVDIAQAAWGDFKPAMPVTFEGGAFAAVGFVLGMFVFAPLRWVLGRLWPRRARSAARAPKRQEPAIHAQAAGARPGLPLGWLARTNSDPHKVVQQGVRTQVAVMAIAEGQTHTGQGPEGGDLVLFAAEGAGQVTIHGTTRDIAADHAVMIPPAAPYELANTGSGLLRLMVVEPRSALGRKLVPIRGNGARSA